ncbi:tRNA lysidine(34) synthetase TilS [Haloimpatiens lingqiaonensis]|uniref:tRNA lysidine(34) synthetase TilS n=1 Tax=Haloimpatiens lingqiaonensis TaxID=1380675 RepID=UPI0010FEC589|nr:tRNA lysidine(34) synthetase TilS [Haloimpatiens lingqiaonensis]
MLQKVLNTIREYQMFHKGDKVIVAVSGGPDSMCLLHMLYLLREDLGIEIAAAHLNHCLRGEEADNDERYVEEYCKKINVEFYSKRVDINKVALEKNISCETAGREERYEFFYELKEKLKAQKIAVAHNANDQAETVLMRLMRGTGLAGAVGIKPIRDNLVVRPIIRLTRGEIESYCEDNGINARIDKTNLQNIYSRNKIRLELIPYMEKNFNKDIVNTINRFANLTWKDNEYIDLSAKDKYKEYCGSECGRIILRKELFKEHEAILSRVLRIALNELKGNLYDLETKHIYDIIHIQKGDTGKQITLPNNIIVANNYGDIHLYKYVPIEREEKQFMLEIGENYKIEGYKISLEMEICSKEQEYNLKVNNFTKYFDYDKIKGKITLRYRKPGDKFQPIGMKGTKKLKDLFMDLKIPKEKRDRIPLICFENEIAWVFGYRISEKFKIDNNTKKVLKIQFKRGE